MIVAAGLTNSRNSRVKSFFEAQAQAPVPVEVESDGRNTGELKAAVDEAAAVARTVNSEELKSQSAEIRTDSQSGLLRFVATAPTADQAKALAEQMQANYLEAAPGGATVEQQLEAILDEATEIQGRLSEFQLPETDPTPADAEAMARASFLSAQINALTQETAKLAVDMVLADSESAREDIEEELNLVSAALIELEKQIAELPPEAVQRQAASDASQGQDQDSVVSDTADVEGVWQKAALEARYAELQEEFETLYLESLKEGGAQLSPTVVSQRISRPVSLPRGLGVGLLGGFLLGVGSLVVDDRLRKPLWASSDFDTMPVLAEVPMRPLVSPEPWYWTAVSGARRRAIQDFQAGLVGFIDEGTTVIGIVGVRAGSQNVLALASDLAASLVMAERTVLLIDANFGPGPTLPGIHSMAPTLSQLLSYPKGDRQATASFIKETLSECAELGPGLSVLPAGTALSDPVEAVMSWGFALMLTEARSQYDTVLIAGPEVGEPLANALSQRIEALVIAVRAGTTAPEVERVAKELRGRRTAVLGAVLLLPGRSRARGKQSSVGHDLPLLRGITSLRMPWKKGRSHATGQGGMEKDDPAVDGSVAVSGKGDWASRNGSVRGAAGQVSSLAAGRHRRNGRLHLSLAHGSVRRSGAGRSPDPAPQA